jgi:hypothetical protein
MGLISSKATVNRNNQRYWGGGTISDSVVDQNPFMAEIVPKSTSAARPGDYVVFMYDVNEDGSTDDVLLLVTRPVVKLPGTENLLFTGIKIPSDVFGKAIYGDDYGPEYMNNLYKEGNFDMDYFRTYMFRKIVGNIIRIKPR